MRLILAGIVASAILAAASIPLLSMTETAFAAQGFGGGCGVGPIFLF